MNSLLIRIISALLFLVILGALYYFLQHVGLKILCGLGVGIAAYELNKILFIEKLPSYLKVIYYVLIAITFYISSEWPVYGTFSVVASIIIFTCCIMLYFENFLAIEKILDMIFKYSLALIYVALLPSFLWRILNLPGGTNWFLSLLIVVFFGDIGAYVVGVKWGRHLLFPKFSPKKTMEGAVGGILGSTLSVAIISQLIPSVPVFSLVGLAIVAAILAQFGDFFESLLKRVAGVKDSGRIMPGHGGLLDRIDGVLFAGPLFFLAASYFEKHII